MPRSALKSEETRQRILAAALRVFREHGFDAATMREIAAAADVAVGAAYYYFASKDAIVMAFYQQAQDEMAPALNEILNRSRTLEQRLRRIIGQKFEYFAPYRALVGTLSAHSDPAHVLSPFSKATAIHSRARHRVFRSRCRGIQSAPARLHSPLPSAASLALSNGAHALLGLRPLAAPGAHGVALREDSAHDVVCHRPWETAPVQAAPPYGRGTPQSHLRRRMTMTSRPLRIVLPGGSGQVGTHAGAVLSGARPSRHRAHARPLHRTLDHRALGRPNARPVGGNARRRRRMHPSLRPQH